MEKQQLKTKCNFKPLHGKKSIWKKSKVTHIILFEL